VKLQTKNILVTNKKRRNKLKNKLIWLVSIALIIAAMLLASCSSSTTAASTQTSSPQSTTTSTQITTTTSAQTTAKVTTTTTTTTGNWWDKLGTPTYGGVLHLRLNTDVTGWDPQFVSGQTKIYNTYDETLFAFNWKTDPTVFNYQPIFTPVDYAGGQLADSWEMPDPNTFIYHLHKGIHWQNIPPANGREFTASDVVYKFDRRYGLGSGMPGAAPSIQASEPVFLKLQSVTASDNYTVVFKFNGVNTEALLEAILGPTTCIIECPDAVKQWGDVQDWHHAIGTGPYILTDVVAGSSATLVKNPNYWGYDDRYPQNQLPYLDGITYLIIPDNATAQAALRTNKLDVMDGINMTDAANLKKTNPEMPQVTYHNYAGLTLDPRNDVKPFSDVRVREAMQQAIDLKTIASTYYGGNVSPNPLSLIAAEISGWGFPYSKWPQDLKDEYAYNPTQAKQLLAAAGYPNGFKTDVVAASNADLDLLQIVKSELSAVGIDMTISTMDPVSWVAFVQNGHKNDALAYKAIGQLAKSYQPTYIVSTYQSGITGNWSIVSDSVYDGDVAKAMAPASSLADVKQAVSDADERCVRQHFDISLLNPTVFSVFHPWFHGYNGQYNAISNGGGGAGTSASFWLGRFWISSH
jgi:peptide/nickel transport system substrate-binding protein